MKNSKKSSKRASRNSRKPSTKLSPKAKTNQPRTIWVIVWWMDTGFGSGSDKVKKPTFAIFDDELAMYSAARVRNALVLKIENGNTLSVYDYKYMDDQGHPIEGEFRDLSIVNGNPFRIANML